MSIFTNVSFLATLGINMLLAAGLYPMVATGQLSLGQAGFMAVGAYASSWANVALGWPIAPAILFGIVFAAAVAVPVAVGATRVRGIYLIVGTLAVGEIIQTVLSNMDAVGGVGGYRGMGAISHRVVWLGTAAGLAVLFFFMRSPVGVAMRSIHDDEDAAEAAGVPTRGLKVIAVVSGAAVTGLAGALFAHKFTFIQPDNFGIARSFEIALFVLIGGSDNLAGAVFGAFLLTYLPEAFKPVHQYREVAFGLFLIVVMILSPGGLLTRARIRSALRPVRRFLPERAEAAEDLSAPPVPEEAVAEVARPAGDHGLALSGLGRRFSGLNALNDVDIRVRPGEIVGLIGPNGAGKSTLVNVATGLLPATTGSVRLQDVDVTPYPAHRRTRAGMARTFQAVRLFDHLTVRENLTVPARLHTGAGTAVGGLLDRLQLAGSAERLPPELAHGVQRRVQVAQSMATQPVILFLDEPSIGLHEEDLAELASMLRDFRDRGVGILLVDHNLDLVMGLADRIVVLDHGQKIAEGTPGEVRDDPDVQRAYLGRPAARPEVGTEPSGDGAKGREPALEISGLTTRYGKVEALHDVSLNVEWGETVALVGRNGAGKTTLLRSVFGLVRPSAGTIRFGDRELVGTPVHAMARLGVGYVPEHGAILGTLSVDENLRLAALGSRNGRGDHLDEVFELFPVLKERARSQAATLSGGQQRMLALGRALVGRPKLLLLDEPSLGLAPKLVDEVFAALARLRDRGMTILVVEQNVRRAMALASRGYLMDLGRIRVAADATTMLSDDEVLSAYLGAAPYEGERR